MFSILLIIAAFRTGDIKVILLVFVALFFVWAVIISEWNRYTIATKQKQLQPKQNPIDKYGDEHYGTIDWLSQRKL